MKKNYSFQDAKAIILTLCDAAKAGQYDSRESFMAMVQKNPFIAVQGYNAYGKVFFWNQASVELYGYREDEAVNKDLFDLVIPEEMRKFARDATLMARKTLKMPEPSPCDLTHHEGHFITVFTGHLVFKWDDSSVPEFYCLDLPLITEQDELEKATSL
ncbi:hypothetical protein PDESU_06490 [Pontiella desulfatans]|uniref:PAS domain-containing protein n=1 Tax=Pontiella desulfatans TaxID=2750659 RepID=A0A6C2UCH7_PONDE|nr:PAS domain-containing protein [Pontiella desulfatans]VGO17888.1 hypothetical protein PDESU_06490 [Pontiella desulfatans]